MEYDKQDIQIIRMEKYLFVLFVLCTLQEVHVSVSSM